MSDVGVERVNGQPRGLRDKDQPLRILWVGVLQPWKAMDLLIDALAHVPMEVPCEVRVMGDGPMRGAWQLAARRKGVDQRITWLGRLPHDEVLRQYAWADAMAFTSLRDTTGTVIAEALAAGTPVIGIDHQGCADVVSPRCGLKVPVMSRPAMSRELARLLLRLAREPDLTSRLSRGALEQAEHYLWSEHGNRMAEVYNRVLEQAGSDCRCILDEENQLPTTRLSMPETSLAQ